MKIKVDTGLVIVGFVALFAIASSALIFDFDEVVMAPFEGEPIKVEITAQGYEEDSRRNVISEKVSLTLELPVYDDPEEETPGFTLVFTVIIVLFTSYIVSKKR